MTAKTPQASIPIRNKSIEDQLFKHEFATSNYFWPKLKDCKSKDLTHTNKVFLLTKIKPKYFWHCFNTCELFQMQWKEVLKEYFSFSRRDRIGILVLFVLILTVYFLPRFYRKKDVLPPEESRVLAGLADSLDKKRPRSFDEEITSTPFAPGNSPGELFPFNPNTLSVEGWQRLGLSLKTSQTIEKYRNKGGRFYKAEDLQKIWGLPNGFYERAKPFIRIENAEPKNYNPPERKKTERTISEIDINSADSLQWLDLPGIGSKLSSRIMMFRERLGGFYKIDQLSEVYGLPDSTFQKIKPFLKVDGEIRKINLNTATIEELKTHPYIKWKLASAIVEYRKQHGDFKNIESLKNIMLVDEVLFEKIKNYLTVE